MNDFTKKELKEAEEKRLKKLEVELSKLRLRQENENSQLKLRINQKFIEFKKKRALDFENLLQTSKNKQENLQHKQKLWLNDLKHPQTAKAKTMVIERQFFKTVGSSK